MKLSWWSDVAIANVDSPDAVVHSEDERFEEMMKMGEYFRKLWNARADAPPTFDLVSMLAHSDATRNLQTREFIGTIGLLIVGGNDTTRNSMSGGLMALVENPEQFELVRARRELIPNLVSEIIRYYTPVLHMRRTARNDVELAGRRIAKGDKVVMWYISGNRDESKIDRADEFIIDRAKPRQHLAFGAGIHRCVGDRLAEQQNSNSLGGSIEPRPSLRNHRPAAAPLFEFHPRHPLAAGKNCELARHSGAMRSIELRCAIAHLRIPRDSGFASRPGMTERENPGNKNEARSR